MTHRNARVFVVLALALHSLSTTQAQRRRLRPLPRQLEWEEDTCMSGDPSPEGEEIIKNRYHCLLQSSNPGFQSYTICEVLEQSEKFHLWNLAYSERFLIDLVALANVTTHQHEQVLEAIEVV